MSNPLIKSVDHFVLLEPNRKERIVSRQEAVEWLKHWISKTDTSTIYQNDVFSDEKKISKFLEDTCELEIEPGYKIKWFAVRIDSN